MPTAFAGPLKLQASGSARSTPQRSPRTDPELEAAFREKPAVHRFPGSMAKRVQDLARTSPRSTAATRRASGPRRATPTTCAARLAALPGFGEMKVDGARRCAREAVRGRRRAGALVPNHPTPRRRRLAGGARRVPGREARAQGGDPRRQAERSDDELRTLTDGGQTGGGRWRTSSPTSSRGAHRRSRSRSTTSGCRTRWRDRPRRARRRASTRGVAVRLAYNVDHARPDAGAAAARARTRSLIESLPFPTARDPGRPRPDAPQVRRARRRGGLDRLDELDGRLVDARGERDRHRRLAPSSRARSRPTSSSSGRRGDVEHTRQGRAATRSRRRRAVRPGSAPSTARSSRTGSRRRSARAKRRVRIASPVITLGADPRHARRGRGRRQASTSRASSTHAGRRGLPPVAARTANATWKIAAAPQRARRGRRSPGKQSTPYAPGTRPRLHAREGHGRRRHRLRRQLQPLALGRAERRERARDRRHRARRPARRLHRRDPVRSTRGAGAARREHAWCRPLRAVSGRLASATASDRSTPKRGAAGLDARCRPRSRERHRAGEYMFYRDQVATTSTSARGTSTCRRPIRPKGSRCSRFGDAPQKRQWLGGWVSLCVPEASGHP